ncbi:Choline-sulfatase [Crateriforma conspicua]|uniref:Choline-sulfatase n=2 Tax=Crateriforma conspicua TaxID=2527996 RepID=A0A5C5Y3E9_9PLAN|nr:Choline-sulfatase [Crateriforma conspicua]
MQMQSISVRLLFGWLVIHLLVPVDHVSLAKDQGPDDKGRRPNVLFIVADDLNCMIRPYGDKTAVTPNLASLADRGIVFQNAYCQQAVCNPSRSSFLTGLRPDTVGVDDLRKGFRDTAPGGESLVTLPQHFKNHGYFCQNIGKIFHNMGDTQDRRSWSIDEVLHAGTHAADTVYTNTAPGLRKERFRKAPVTESLAVPDIAYRDGQIANLAAAMLRDYPQNGMPFFLAVGFWRPHLPFVAPKKYWDLYDPRTIPMPQPLSPPAEVPDIAMHDSREVRGYDGPASQDPFTPESLRHLRHGYYASISFLDAQIGEILRGLRDGGHWDNTIVVFTSDHGFHMGEKSLIGKTSNFELDARVPLIIADPRRPDAHGRSTRSLTELVDLYPTLASLAGIQGDLSDSLQGVDVSAVIESPDLSVKDVAFTQHQHPFYGAPSNWRAWGRSIRTADWRYTEWHSIDDGSLLHRELYDQAGDPTESANVVARHPVVADEHARRLRKHFGP